MTNNLSQMRMYALVATVLVVLLLVVQMFALRSFAAKSQEFAITKEGVTSSKSQVEAKAKLLSEYKSLKNSAPKEKMNPESALELYTIVDKALNDNAIEHTNRSSSAGTVEQGGALQIQIDFRGSYYGLLKALAALRDAKYLMRISTFHLNGEDNGRVSGSMTVLSTVKS